MVRRAHHPELVEGEGRGEISRRECLLNYGLFIVANNDYKKMHSRVLGLLAHAAFKNHMKMEIERSWKLSNPLPSKKQRNQLHYAPDLTLYSEDFSVLLGFADYESTDITEDALDKKKHFIQYLEKPGNNGENLFYLFIVTIPDRMKWPRSIRKEHIPPLKDAIRDISIQRPEFIYCLMTIDITNIEVCMIEKGKVRKGF
jgi:hypothetical protein